MAGAGYAVIRDALRKTNKVGLGQVVIGGRDWLVAGPPPEDGLVAEYFDEVPSAKPQKEMIDLAVQLVD